MAKLCSTPKRSSRAALCAPRDSAPRVQALLMHRMGLVLMVLVASTSASRLSTSRGPRIKLALTQTISSETFSGLVVPTSSTTGPSITSLGQSLRDVYDAASTESYVLTAGLQAAALSSLADGVSQSVHGLSVDFAHVAAMATIAFSLSGSLNAVWLRFLEEQISGTSIAAISSKTFCDWLCCATFFNSAYLALVPVLTALYSGIPLEEASPLMGWSLGGFQAAMALEAITFSPYNLFAFRVVPPRLRPLTSAMLSATCTIVISGLTLGFPFLTL